MLTVADQLAYDALDGEVRRIVDTMLASARAFAYQDGYDDGQRHGYAIGREDGGGQGYVRGFQDGKAEALAQVPSLPSNHGGTL